MHRVLQPTFAGRLQYCYHCNAQGFSTQQVHATYCFATCIPHSIEHAVSGLSLLPSQNLWISPAGVLWADAHMQHNDSHNDSAATLFSLTLLIYIKHTSGSQSINFSVHQNTDLTCDMMAERLYTYTPWHRSMTLNQGKHNFRCLPVCWTAWVVLAAPNPCTQQHEHIWSHDCLILLVFAAVLPIERWCSWCIPSDI